MSTELRRIKRIIRDTREDPASQSLREANNPLLNKSERQVAFQKVADDINANIRRSKQKQHTYALSKVRVVEGCITLPQLAAERGIQAQLARLWLKNAGIPKPGERWVWKAGSKALVRARKALELKP